MFTFRNKYHQECTKEAKINENELHSWIEQQDLKVGGFIKLLDHTLVRCEQINQDIQASILELIEHYNIIKRNFFRVAALYNNRVSEKKYKYISLLLTKLSVELEDLQHKPGMFLKEQLSIIEWKINIDRENLVRGENYSLIKLLKSLGNANELNLKEKMIQSIVQKKFRRQEENNNQEG
ncbi:hypothetical protein NOVO_07510 [Rickettsiales bacterium Ac37b]|nr:hypothetical protein NOVO_07510 [Rickettsiales bacterium Ac37b]